MNIFALDPNPSKAAEYHCNMHVVKMSLESAQMLSTNCFLNGLPTIYKPTHANHPSTIWARTSLENWLWLKELAYYLNEEYKKRFNHSNNHKSWDVIEKLETPNLPKNGLTPFAQAMFPQFKSNNSIHSYRLFYAASKFRFAKWSNNEPDWWNDYRKYVTDNKLEVINNKNDGI